MTTDVPPITLPARIRAFLETPRFASIGTIDPDGMPRQSVVWYLLEGDTLVINSKVGRRWPANLRRDRRIALSVIDIQDGYSWIGLTGSVDVVEDPDQALADISAMARRYYPDDPGYADDLIARRFRTQRRISFRIHVNDVHDHLPTSQ